MSASARPSGLGSLSTPVTLALVTFAPVVLAATPSLAVVNLGEVSHPFPAVTRGDVDWVDFDLDGDLDLFVTGNPEVGDYLTELWRNDGGGSFANSGIPFPGVWQSDADWDDFDGDGDPDVVLCGGLLAGGSLSRAYRNDRTSFVDVGAPFTNTMDGAVTFHRSSPGSEFVILFGRDDPSYFAYPIVNGQFLPPLPSSGAAFLDAGATSADLDGNGVAEILYAGSSDVSGSPVPVLRLEGLPGALEVTFEGLDEAAVAIGDLDADGLQDFAACGMLANGTAVTRVYRQQPGGTFVLTNVGTGVSRGDVAWADVDSDGDLDLAYCGQNDAGTEITGVLEQTNGNFVAAATLVGARLSSLAWGDYDGDGDLDLLVTGRESDDVTRCRLYRNQHFLLNSGPSAPTGLQVSPTAAYLDVSWNPGTDFETPVAGLTYAVRAGTAAGGQDLLSAAAAGNGVRGLVRAGNVDHPQALRTRVPIFGQESGSFHVSVQTVDGGYRGSPFTAGVSTFLPFTQVAAYTDRYAHLDAGDVDGDGEAELVVAGYGVNGIQTAIYDFDAAPYAEADSIVLGGFPGEVRFADVDNDNDLDVAAVAAFPNAPPGPARGGGSRIVRNDGGTWVETSSGLPAGSVIAGEIGFADYDRDGDYDLAMSSIGLYRNDGGTFVPTTALEPATFGYLDWVDYDRDADLDLAVSGAWNVPGRGGREVRIHRNDGGTLTVVQSLPVVEASDIAWIDHDGDGDEDLFVSAYGVPALWRNDGGLFVEDPAAIAGNIHYTAAELVTVDFDHDGDPDLIAGGFDPSRGDTGNGTFFRNDGGVFHVQTSALWPRTEYRELAIGDYDGDGSADLFAVGSALYASPGPLDTFHNNAPANSAPSAPTNLSAGLVGDLLVLTWSPSLDAETPSGALTYNVRIGTTVFGSEFASPQADPATGRRHVARRGNVGAAGYAVFDVSAVAAPTLYWTVQAVDGSYRGSPFATVQQIVVNDVGAPEIPPAIARLRLAPNPFREDVEIAWDLPRHEEVSLEIFDVAGRRLRTLVREARGAGTHSLGWDGRDARGRSVAPGVYLVRLKTEGRDETERIVRLR
ncbi:MAG: VCBS repeat-containing protein [Gemmatimonadetes bacterium]|nr:VCBS repeat-containing protein [Gemmatimonadota bacterium]